MAISVMVSKDRITAVSANYPAYSKRHSIWLIFDVFYEIQFAGEHKANADINPARIKSFGRFLESGRFPKGGALWSPSAEGEIPQQPDRKNRIELKAQTIDGRQEF